MFTVSCTHPSPSRPSLPPSVGYELMNLSGYATMGERGNRGKALFSSKIFGKMTTVAISFIFDKYCSIMD